MNAVAIPGNGRRATYRVREFKNRWFRQRKRDSLRKRFAAHFLFCSSHTFQQSQLPTSATQPANQAQPPKTHLPKPWKAVPKHAARNPHKSTNNQELHISSTSHPHNPYQTSRLPKKNQSKSPRLKKKKLFKKKYIYIYIYFYLFKKKKKKTSAPLPRTNFPPLLRANGTSGSDRSSGRHRTSPPH